MKHHMLPLEIYNCYLLVQHPGNPSWPVKTYPVEHDVHPF